MKIRYIGGNDSIEIYGIVFEGTKPVDVPDDLVAGYLKKLKLTIMAVDKLKNNPEFEEVAEPKETEITRADIMGQLSERGVQFNKNSNKDVLLGLLNGNDDGS